MDKLTEIKEKLDALHLQQQEAWERWFALPNGEERGNAYDTARTLSDAFDEALDWPSISREIEERDAKIERLEKQVRELESESGVLKHDLKVAFPDGY